MDSCIFCRANLNNGNDWCEECDAELFPSMHGRHRTDGEDGDGIRCGVEYTPSMVRQ